ELITVVMGGKAVDGKLQIYEDTIKLLEYGFNNFSTQTIVRPGDIVEESPVAEAKDSDYIILQSDQYLEALLPKDVKKEEIEKDITLLSDIRAPIKKGDVIGTVTYKYQGQVLGKVNLISDRSIEKEPIVAVTNQTMSIASSLTNKLWFKAVLGALGAFTVAILILKIASSRRIKRNRYIYVNDSKIRYIYKDRRK
ncbi:MAG: hypothetical protein GX066_08395, partial [Clostridiaceae bacterium]|nr:hypothetical protein [Clostridiaceae bacterium]